jgi:hypothetical protein
MVPTAIQIEDIKKYNIPSRTASSSGLSTRLGRGSGDTAGYSAFDDDLP